MTGKVKWYNETKAYGFIYIQGADKDLFFHKNQWKEEYIPAIGDQVKFTIGESVKGRQAENITFDN